ncbi:MAG: S8 family serine peptidase [Rehaibacterium terrae]|uniref:S8 family serine peptidase n=1 Tax=Rehaibacterium terrae TaxID=1341696 RepID=UPI00391B0440
MHSRLGPHSLLPLAIAAALLTACGGGSSNTKPSPPPAGNNPPPQQVCNDPNAANHGGPLPCVYRYQGPLYNATVPINADRAHAAGFTGQGVKIGILDSGADRSIPSLTQAVVWYRNYMPADQADPNREDVRGHGSIMAQLAAGRRSGEFPGGAAPGALVYAARICTDQGLCDIYDRVVPATRDMAAEGVRIFNFSIGGAAWRGTEPVCLPDSTDPVCVTAYNNTIAPEVLATNPLYIWATGNDGNATQPSVSAAFPAMFPHLRGNWLAVVGGYVEPNGTVQRLETSSSMCGVAAQWCITAPGSGRFLPGPGVGSSGGGVGTSLATAITTGAAAVVSSAFPWMGGDLIQLSLLTTATDLGAPGVDEVFGWGLINLERAIRGPAQFAFGDVTANVNREGSWTWANDIGGAGGLIKTGIGRLLLSGDNSYSGATFVDGGTLALSGTLRSPVTVRSGGTFEALGGTIHGSYTAQAGSTTALQVGSPLRVHGTASLDGTLRILAPASAGYAVGDHETLLFAEAINGRFSSVQVASGFFYDATLTYNLTTLVANLTRKSAAAAAAKAGAMGATLDGASHFDALMAWSEANGFVADAAKVLNAPDQAAALNALSSLSGEIHGSARNGLLQTSDQVARTLGDRVEALSRQGGAGGWFAAQTASGDLAQSGFGTIETRGNNLLAGADAEIGAATVGGVIGKGKARSEVHGDRFEADRVLAGVYGRVDGERGYVSGSLTREWLDVEVSRNVAGDRVRAERDDKIDQVRVEAGLKRTVSPFVAVRSATYRMGGFAESGSDLGLVAGADTHTATFGEIGARYAANFRLGGGDAWLSATARYQRVLNGAGSGFAASFAGAPVSFTARGQDIERERGVLGLSFNHAFREGWTWFVDAEAEIDGGGIEGRRVSVGVRGAF